MPKYTVMIDLNEKVIISGYYNHFGKTPKKPTKKDISNWIGGLAQADIEAAAFYEDSEENEK